VERTVTPGGTGANRLEPDAAILGVAHRDLRDLRLHDANGIEHAYLLVPPPERQPQWKQASLRAINATKTSSGFEADFKTAAEIDRIRIEGLRAPLMKKFRLEGSGDRSRWIVLAAEATVFDLPDEQLKNLEVAFDPGTFRYLRVTWDDASSERVRSPGTVSARIHNIGAPATPQRVKATFRAVASETGKSRYRITLPGPHLPVKSIELHAANPNVFRDASVSEGRLSGSTVQPVQLGASKLRRAERSEVVAEQMAVPISFPEGPDLDLVIDDGNNPPLSLQSVEAVFAPLPWIYFESPDEKPLTATYGDPALNAPSYDLEARRAAATNAATVDATWSEAKIEKPLTDVIALAPLSGAPLDRKLFRFSRAIAPTQRGLTSLLLDADVLARSNALRDVRIAGYGDYQVPYIVEHRDAPTTIAMRIPARTQGERTHSIYHFELPYDTLPEGTRIAITTSSQVFERTANLMRPPDESRGRDREVIASETWRSASTDDAAPTLIFTAPLSGSRSVELDLDEGDNAPLAITGAQLLLPSYALRFISPGGPLTLLYGNSGADAPRYDLAILAPHLFGEPARDISLTRAAPMVATPESRTERKIFWMVIVGAVIALLITLSRLLSK
jgi:hypothetical protein